MAGFRTDRLAQDVKRELSELLTTLKDPRINGMLSIVRLELSNDLSSCKVYVSSLDGLEGAKRAVEGLESAKGFVRREIGMRIRMRRTPEFKFIADDSIEYGAKIARVIEELKGDE